MPQVVRDGTGHPPDGRETLRFQQILLGLEQAFAHGVECACELSRFVTPGSIQRIAEVTLFKCGNSSQETRQWACKGIGNDKHQDAPENNGKNAQTEQEAVQPL